MKDSSTKELLKSLEGKYTDGEFKASIDVLLKNKDKFEAGLFHYNLGTLYSKAGDDAAGRFHLEKALSKGFVNTQVLNNLNAVKSRLQVRDISNSPKIYDQVINKALLVPSSFYLTVTLFFLFLHLLTIKMKLIKSRVGMIIGFFIALIPVLFSIIFLSEVNYAVALRDAPMFDGPSKIYFEKGVLQAGSKVIVGKNTNGWILIEHPLSLAGWVNTNDLGFY